MRKRRLFVVTFLIIAFAAIVYFFAPASPMIVTASFVGYTNDATGGQLAMFAVTNGGSVTVRRWGFYVPESRLSSALPTRLNQLGPNVFLAPGQFELISLTPPTNAGPWRAVFHCSRDGLRRSFSDWMGQGSGGVIHAIVPDRFVGLPTQKVKSDWVDQK